MVNRRALFLLILGVTGTGIMGNTLLAPAVPNILDEFGVSDSGAGLLIAATSFPGIFMAPVIGVLADRLGRRRVLVPCLAMFGVSGIAAALAPSFAFLIVARLGMGVGATRADVEGEPRVSHVLMWSFFETQPMSPAARRCTFSCFLPRTA